MGDQALVQLAGEQGDAVRAGVVAEEVVGHADLKAAGLEQDTFVEIERLLLEMRELNGGMIFR